MQLNPTLKSGEIGHIGRYRILEVLGQGAMAIVYKAYDPNIDRTLAIKVLREEKCIDEEYRERFLREARAAGNLSHPNIVTVYDVGEFDNRPYIVMEIVEGKPLDKVMKLGKQMSLPNIISISIQLAKALDYAHKNGVVHRDIKPSNIIYPAKGNTVKITDFGIAHLENTDMTQQTQAGEILGTPQYMSPEQVLGQAVDGRSDLFSVGVVMYQMISGQKPFTGGTIASLLFQIATEEPKPLDRIAKSAPSALRQIIEKLLHKQPSKRFQSGEELARTIVRLVRDKDEKDDKDRIVPLRVKWTFIMSALVGAVLIVGLYIIYQRQYQAMLNQAIDYGGSMVKFIANESAIPLLEGDVVAIEVIVQVANQRQEEDASLDLNTASLLDKQKAKSKKKDIQYITIIDRDNIIRGHINPAKVGRQYKAHQKGKSLIKSNELNVIDYKLSSSESVFEFSTPILFKNRQEKIQLGRVFIGISQAPLQDVIQATIVMMLVLMIAVIGAVMVIAYVFGVSLARPILTLKRSMKDVSRGHLETRIIEKRTDEFGQLFNSFNQMTESLQHQEKDKNQNLDDTGMF